jgi:dihydroorotase
MRKIILKNARMVNEGQIIEGDLLIENSFISKVGGVIDSEGQEVDVKGNLVIPGIIDDQVHFREPGLTYKGNIASESRAALMGGVTTFMEMPNTKPPALTQGILEHKYEIANKSAYTNYSFFMGASNDNLEEVLRTDPNSVCGIKAFMGSSTGNMLVDDPVTLEKLFSKVPMLIATHCEDENTIRKNHAHYVSKFGRELTASYHPIIRNEEGCYLSSSLAVDLAKKYNTRLHILHISTAKELDLFRNDIPLSEKRITSEACVHHMYFCDEDYNELGNKIKCNPAIKRREDKDAIFAAILDDTIDIIATDHAPHTAEEKSNHYLEAPSGLPLVQHSLNIMLDFHFRGKISLEKIVEKMCHAPAECFQIYKRGFIREGYFADLAIVDLKREWEVLPDNIAYKCGWSPLEGKDFKGKVVSTFVNGSQAYIEGEEPLQRTGYRITFDR